MNSKINVILLCGGRGTRLFPLSRDDQPKQFLPTGQNQSTLFHKTCNLVSNFAHSVYLSTSKDYINTILGYKLKFDKIISEPCSRNTAPSILASLLSVNCQDDEIFMILPCDHNISDINALISDIEKAVKYAKDGNIVTFGISVECANIEFGYIEKSVILENKIYKSNKFVEKPSINIATKLHDSGNYLWNSGIYIGKKSTFVSEFRKSDINFFNLVESSLEMTLDNIVYLNNNYQKTESISIDKKISENCQKIITIEASFSWSDVGSFETLSELTDLNKNSYPHDSFGNNIFNMTSKNIYLNGINDLNIISTHDAILISKKCKDIKDIYNLAKINTPTVVESTPYGVRPWGHYEVIHHDGQCKVKKLVLLPNSEISLQYHNFRTEYWVIISGNGFIELNNRIMVANVGDSITINPGDIHKLSNNSNNENLILIEVQSGSDLSENDIFRVSDKYNRKN